MEAKCCEHAMDVTAERVASVLARHLDGWTDEAAKLAMIKDLVRLHLGFLDLLTAQPLSKD